VTETATCSFEKLQLEAGADNAFQAREKPSSVSISPSLSLRPRVANEIMQLVMMMEKTRQISSLSSGGLMLAAGKVLYYHSLSSFFPPKNPSS
jgi:hypothetical protein